MVAEIAGMAREVGDLGAAITGIPRSPGGCQIGGVVLGSEINSDVAP